MREKQSGEDDRVERDVILAVHVIVACVFAEQLMKRYAACCAKPGGGGKITEHILRPDINSFVLVSGFRYVDTPILR